MWVQFCDRVVMFVQTLVLKLQKLIVRLIQDPVRLWTSESATSLVSSSHSLLKFAMLEAAGSSESSEMESEAHKTARSLIHSLGTLSTVGRRCKLAGSSDSSSVFREFWSLLLPNLYQLLACVHACMSPATKLELSAVPEKLWLTAVSPEESGYCLGEVYEHDLLPPAARLVPILIFDCCWSDVVVLLPTGMVWQHQLGCFAVVLLPAI